MSLFISNLTFFFFHSVPNDNTKINKHFDQYKVSAAVIISQIMSFMINKQIKRAEQSHLGPIMTNFI